MQPSQINLFQLGVPESYHGSKPRASLFPERLNPDAREHWERLFKNPLVQKVMDDMPGHGQRWAYAVHMYFQKCKDKGVVPFSGSTGTKNQKILKFLISARRQVVVFLDAFGLYSQFKVKHVHREFKLKDNGLTILSSCKLGGVTDLANFIEHISNSQFRFRKALGNKRYSTMINSFLFCHIDIGGSANNIRLTYEIRCHSLPDVRLQNRVVSDKDFHRFIAQRIWLPAVRSARFFHSTRPSLF